MSKSNKGQVEQSDVEKTKTTTQEDTEVVEKEIEQHEPETATEDSSTVEMQTAEFQQLDTESVNELKEKKLDLLMDLSLPVAIELGRTNLMIKDILNLQRGSIVEFEKLASEPVDILINGKKMAEGEVVVIEKHFGIRITNLIDTSERIRSLGS